MLQGDEQPQLRLFPFQHAFQVANLSGVHVPALDLHDDAFGFAAVVVEEIDVAVDAGVGASAFVVGRASVHQAQRPPLELVAVLLGQRLGAGNIGGFADDFVGTQIIAEGVVQAVPDQRDGQVGNVDADPAAVEPFRRGHRCTTPAERVQHHVALVAAGPDDALQQCFGFLRGVAEAFFWLNMHRGHIVPKIL